MIEQFVTPGMFVFDIGANDGTFARECVAIGARVLAVEPNRHHLPDLMSPGVTPVIAAVGATHGTAKLHLSHNTKWSSLHPEWVTGHYGKASPDWETTEVITLDMLINEFGVPDFLKIDTEGNEAEVLRGLTRRLPLLSFEYHGGQYPVKLLSDPLQDCVGMLPGYEFRAAQHETEWVTDWVCGEDLVTVAAELTWGDVYARAVSP